jgi:hypothetical protein
MTRLLKDLLYETICGEDRIEVALPDFIQYTCRYYLVLVKLRGNQMVLGLFLSAQGLQKCGGGVGGPHPPRHSQSRHGISFREFPKHPQSDTHISMEKATDKIPSISFSQFLINLERLRLPGIFWR